MRPGLVIVAGAPATGKSTLARLIGDALPAPVLDKDAIKSGLCLTEQRTAGRNDPTGPLAFELLWSCAEVLCRAGCTAVAEAAFHREFLAEPLGCLAEVCDVSLVMCEVPAALSVARYRQRARSHENRKAHADELVLEEMADPGFPWSTYDVADLVDRQMRVRTEAGYEPSLEAILAFAGGGPVGPSLR